MPSLTQMTAGVLACLLLAGCGADLTAPTGTAMAPTLKLNPSATYTFTLTCGAGAEGSFAFVAALPSGSGTSLDCGEQFGPIALTGWFYGIVVRDGALTLLTNCDQTDRTFRRTGSFTCKKKGASATLTLSEAP